MAEVLLESQPSVVVAALILRQWYAIYHEDSGPLHIGNAEDLEQYLGDDIRREYPYFTDRALHGVLMRRRRSVLLCHKVVRTWIEKYAPRRIIRRQSAAAVWGTAGESSAKRAKVSGALVVLVGAAALEDACGERYRREVSDLGLAYCFFRYRLVNLNILVFLFLFAHFQEIKLFSKL